MTLQIVGLVARAVHEIVVGSEQPGLGHLCVAVRHDAVLAPPRVRRRHQSELARHADIVLDHLPGSPVRAQDRHRERHAAVVAGEPALAQRLDALARMRHLGERFAALVGGFAVPCANTARMPLSTSRRPRVRRCSMVVMLWHQSTSVVTPASICASAPDQVAEVVVFRLIARREIDVHVLEIIRPTSTRRRCRAAPFPRCACAR